MSGNEAVTRSVTAAKTAQASQGSDESGTPSLADLVPAVADAPKGEVTLGEKAGALGPWRAHQVIDGIAEKIAQSVVTLLTESETSAPRVLVVNDRLLLSGDWTADYVRSSLHRLQGSLISASDTLEEQTRRLDRAVAASGPEAERSFEQAQGPAGGRRRGIDSSTAEVTPAVPSGALDAAVNLLGLLRTDYTITATAVSAPPSELSTLTAARLARPRIIKEGDPPVTVPTHVDGFSTVGSSSRIAYLFRDVMELRDRTVRKLSDLQGNLAPVQAELAAISARTASVEQAWIAAIADNKDAGIATLQTTLDMLAEQSARRAQAAGPAAAAAALAQQAVTDVDTTMASLLRASGAGESPLLTSVRYELLGEAAQSREITHVLYVSLDAVAADAITRRSILGVSGRIRFLSSGSASWLLMNTADGSIADGGQASLADVMSFGLDTGKAEFHTTPGLTSSDAGTDPLEKLEAWAKGFVVILVIALFALGALSVIAVIRTALG